MASKHQAIQTKVGIDWSVEGRGRLYNCSQGMATPIGADNPVWFGPLTRKFKGFSDKFGFEYVNGIPVFCVVEIKTKKDRVRPAQKDFLNFVKSIGGQAYIAWEADNDKGYYLQEWL